MHLLSSIFLGWASKAVHFWFTRLYGKQVPCILSSPCCNDGTGTSSDDQARPVHQDRRRCAIKCSRGTYPFHCYIFMYILVSWERISSFSNRKIRTLTLTNKNKQKTDKSKPSQLRTRGVVEKCDLMVMISACVNPWISHCVSSSDWFPRIFVPFCLSLPRP